VIISASYKTDIPTFYGPWFLNRLRAGFCLVVNPYNKQAYRVALDRASVDGIIFWTKNIGPFLRYLPEVRDRGFPFVVQHTINGYPRELETSVINWEQSVEQVWQVRERFGPQVVVWRYDTILLTSFTSRSFHVENFARLAERLAGATNEVVVSFAQFYRKTKRNLDSAAQTNGFKWFDPSDEEKRTLVQEFVRIASGRGIQLTVCSQKSYVVPGAAEARCADVGRMEAVAGRSFKAKLKGNRPECGCFESRDIGDYDSCPHGCVYCYAVQNRELALTRYKRHDPDSPFLFEPPSGTQTPPGPGKTLPLFDE
jgi:hypothetical protein